MNVVYCVTNDYIEKIQPSIRSLKKFNDNVTVYVVTEQDNADGADYTINVKDQKWFPESGVNYHNQFTHIGLLKVCYPYLIHEERVIHLDADTIINDTLEPMWETDLNGKWFAACDETLGKYKPFGEHYWNAGVMVLNLEQLRKDDPMPRMIEYLNTVKQPWCEQDAFNFTSAGKVVALDKRYNECFATGYTNDPAIIHYAGIGNWWNNKSMYRADYLFRFR